MINKEKLAGTDKSDMFSVLRDFHIQAENALNIGFSADYGNLDLKGINNIILNGLGGSAIGGDLIRSYVQNELKVPMMINRNYGIPEFANENTLSIISSYSGDTEETNSTYSESIKKGCRVMCITSGGNVERTALKNKHTLIKVDGGLQPRCALGYSFFGLLSAFIKTGFIGERKTDIENTLNLLREKSELYSDFENENNPAIRYAEKIKSTLPVIYTSADVLDIVNLRWRGQISENAKILAYGNLYPEMNHNELVGWKFNEDIMKKITVIFLYDEEDNSRIKLRMKFTKDIFAKYAKEIIEINGKGKSRLERIFDLIYLGDWISYYLAILNNVDPTPVEVISSLKEKLSKF